MADLPSGEEAEVAGLAIAAKRAAAPVREKEHPAFPADLVADALHRALCSLLRGQVMFCFFATNLRMATPTFPPQANLVRNFVREALEAAGRACTPDIRFRIAYLLSKLEEASRVLQCPHLFAFLFFLVAW